MPRLPLPAALAAVLLLVPSAPADDPTPPPPDVYKYNGLPPAEAARVMTVPDGFQVKLFAGEPDVMQPIALCLDDRGRLWVAEAYTYPRRKPFDGPTLPPEHAKEGDRIIIFEDTDGDGKFDKRTVFMEGLNLVSGLEVGFGGVWVGAAPYLLYIPIKAGADQPAGPPQILLDGWHMEDTHETLNTFRWGPDGWLYGCHGVFTHSRVGKPGTPDSKRIPINAGIWRYHPTRHVFEVFSEGTSNPWGIDWNDYGQLFCEACVIPHAYHLIQGGRYLRQAGNHFNSYTYADINTIVDHFHYLGATPHGGNNRSDSAGGGHAHCGLMLYEGGSWPAEYRDKMFMGNIHGRRLNMDVLKPRGSGYVAAHGHDFLMANDGWARLINMRYGPDGNVYLIDWYDKQACHWPEPQVWDRTNGRIYKICYRDTQPVTADLTKLSDVELAKLQRHPNDWFVRHARRLLQEHHANLARDARPAADDVRHALRTIAFEQKDETRRLRGLWALHVYGGLDEGDVMRALQDAGPHVRAWAIQLALESGHTFPAVMQKLVELAQADPSPVVRLYLASGLQRLPLDERWAIAEAGLVQHAEDAGDHNLPLLYWYALEPLAGANPARALALAAGAKVPLLEFMTRRVAAAGTPEALGVAVHLLSQTDDVARQLVVLAGLQEATRGRRRVQMPAEWAEVYGRLRASPDTEVKLRATTLGVACGDGVATETMRGLLADRNESREVRLRALAALQAARDRGLPATLVDLLNDHAVRGPALRALATFDDPQTPARVLPFYAHLGADEKRDAVRTLASRPSYARELMKAVADKRIPVADVPADVVRQLANLNDTEVNKSLAELYGSVRKTPADRVKLINHYRGMVRHNTGFKPDRELGRAIYAKTCAQCHTLFGTGGKVGPDITGANRGNLDYLLENVLDPSAVIPKEYAATLLELHNGRVITGIVREETPAALTVVTANETLTVPRAEIASRTPTNVSMMPEDQLKPMNDDEVRALFAYLQSPQQVPMLATAENAKDFFNGKDLTGWDGDPKLWHVENGEIVGKSPGIKHNEFLKSHLAAADFRLTLKVRLVPNSGNSGVQFRSETLKGGPEMKGYQADIGAGWWGKLYEENGREILSNKSGEPYVKVDDWNEYEIYAVGSRLKTFLNGHPCVDLDDPKGARRGIFGLQIHAGGPMEVRFKDVKLEVNPK